MFQHLRDVGPSPIELTGTKNAIKNSYVFKFDSDAEVLERKVVIELLKYPKDYEQTFIPKISAVTLDDVRAVAQKHWDLSHAVLIVVGTKRAFESVEQGLKANPGLMPGYKVVRARFGEKLETAK